MPLRAGSYPFTWLKNAGQIPFYYSHNLTKNGRAGKKILERKRTSSLSVGHGLSYTTFAFSKSQGESA